MASSRLKYFTTILIFILAINKIFAGVIVDGYTDKRSYNPGDTISVFINAAGTSTNTEIFLLDIENARADSIITNVFPQSISNASPWENGFGYIVTTKYIVPSTLRSGIYSWENKIFFIIKSQTKNAAITLLYPTNTEEAYNYAGTKSLYDYNSVGGRAHIVSFQRAFNSWMITATKSFTTPLVQWLYSLTGYDVQMIADVDMDDYSEIQNSRILIVAGHSEYWTRQGRNNFDQFVNSGKDAVILSGNTMWWQVRYSSDKTQLICYKDSALDPEQDVSLKTINWPTASLNYSVLNSIGADWIHGAYANKSSYHGYYGFRIMSPNSPLLSGTGVSYHSTIACQANETDAMLFSGFNNDGDPIPDTVSQGFCKVEMIGYDWGESIYYPNNPQRGYGTFLAFRKNSTSGNIINVGNSNWCANSNVGSSQGGFSGADSLKIKTITLNMLNLLLAGSDIYSTPCGCAVITNQVALQSNPCKLFPNPTSGELTFQFDSAFENDNAIEIYDATGQVVLSQILGHSEEEKIDLSNLVSGTYFYFIRTEDTIISRGKVMVVH